MNIIVTGANGQLGNKMRRVSVTSSNQYFFTDVVEKMKSTFGILFLTGKTLYGSV